MASFNFKSFGQLLQDMIDTMTANANNVINFGEGSVVRVLFEAVASRLDYFTILLKKILKLCRLATSEGSDVDSFTDDFGMDSRLAATYGRGEVTLTRFNASSIPVRIAVGSTILANDDSVTYEVVADENQSGYDVDEEAYFIAADETTVDVTVQATTAGTIGNVGANTLTVIGSSLAGVDQVTNATAITNAIDAETDTEMRTRFKKFVETRARATENAIEYAIEIVRNGLTYVTKENIDLAGNVQEGHVVVVIDDGTGDPDEDLLDAIRTSIDLYRGFTIQVSVYPPTILETDASCTITAKTGYTLATVQDNVETAIEEYMNTLPFEAFFPVNKLADIAFGVDGVKDIESMQLNGGSTDVQAEFHELIRPGTITVS